MKKEEIIAYFDRQAPTWDEEMVRSDEKIGKILDCGGVTEGKRIGRCVRNGSAFSGLLKTRCGIGNRHRYFTGDGKDRFRKICGFRREGHVRGRFGDRVSGEI